eukprot:GILK01010955.1.p1 GENE.GILK01010955.1~~GILK01010955.1.p1  ORF type:complete len:1401 (-),score=269.56 GILK01010955.1:37-3882(-)
MSTGRLVQTSTGHTSSVNSVCVTGDGQHLVSADGRTIKIWGMSMGRLVYTFTGERDSEIQIWASSGHNATLLLTPDKDIQVWDESVLKCTHKASPGSFHLGKDGNIYQYVDNTRSARLLYADSLHKDSVLLALSCGRSLPGKFSNFVAASLLDLPEALDKFVRRYGNDGIDDPQPDTNMSALAYALILGHLEVVRILLLHGADLSQVFCISDGTKLTAMDLGYSEETAIKMRWFPPTLALPDYHKARQSHPSSYVLSLLVNNPIFSDALIHATLDYIDRGNVDLSNTAKKLNQMRRLRTSQVAVQLDELIPASVDFQQLCASLERHRSAQQDDAAVSQTCQDLTSHCERVVSDASSHRANGTWTLDNPGVLNDDLSSVKSLLERLAAMEVTVRSERECEELAQLDLVLSGLSTTVTVAEVSDSFSTKGDHGAHGPSVLDPSLMQVDKALHALAHWQSEVQTLDTAPREKTERAAAVVQSRLRGVLDCFGEEEQAVDECNLDIQSALGELHDALGKEKEYYSNHQDVLKEAFPTRAVAVALQAVRDVKRARLQEIQTVLYWNDRLIELKEKLENAITLHSQLDYKHLYAVHLQIEDLRLDIEEFRVSQRRRQRTMAPDEGKEQQQQAIAEKKLTIKRLARELDIQKSILVCLAQVGFVDAMDVAIKLGGVEWSALKLEDFEDLESLAAPGQRRMLFKATLDGEAVVLKEYGLHSPQSWQQLQNELKMLRRVQNPHVMPLRAAFVSEDRFKAYAVFPFFANGALDHWVETMRRSNKSSSDSISNTQWESVWRQVLSGVKALHDCRIIHCDIKPSNIFVDANHRVIVGDFDISQDTSQRTQPLATLSKVAGTLGFIAPELLSTPPQFATSMVDMFAFGKTVETVMTSEELKASGAFEELVKRCQSRSPDERPTAAEALACPFFTQQVVQEKEELERQAKHIAVLQAEVFAASAQVEAKKGQVAKDEQELRALLVQLEQDKQQTKKTAEELRKEQTRVETLQRQVRADQNSVYQQTKQVSRLQNDIEQERKHLQKVGRIPRYPPYWCTCKYDLSLFQKVDVTADVKKEMQSLFDKCCNVHTLGHGRDQQQAGSYSQLEVHTVWRVENFKLWNKFMARKMELKSLGKGVKGATGTGTETVSTDQDSWVRDTQLNGRLNEKFLFHGTDAVVADIICEHGFDERVAALGGMFGAGIYFAEQSSKSDQYVRRDSQGLFYMFVSRVMLGTQVYHTQGSMIQIRRPPDLPGQRGRCFDSVVFDATGQHYREFIVYDRTQAYPEFLVAYERQ